MFDQRLKIILLLLAGIVALLLLRAAQLQVVNASYWREQATESMKRPRQIETTRGRILDRKGRPIAIDAACIDACVDYRAVIDPPDPDWVRQQALKRLRRNDDEAYSRATRAARAQMIDAESERVVGDIKAMWQALARESGRTQEEIDEACRAVSQKVYMRRRVVWYARYRRALDEHASRGPSPWYRRWLIEGESDAPELDSFSQEVAEEEEAHPIIRDIDNDTLIRLKKNQEKYPGLVLREGVIRRYPYNEVACHTIGHMGRVTREDLQNDPNLDSDDPSARLRAYQYNDDIGRSGLESLLEPTLRGTRGEVTKVIGQEEEAERIDPEPGKDVRVSLDIELQRDIEQLFKRVVIQNADRSTETLEMHGAAVVIDVPTGEVLALASYPNYDLNRFDELYNKLATDDFGQPLLNRATQWACEPGSTVKPMVGLGAITDGLVGVNEGIECTGYMVLNGKPIRHGFRCWTASGYDHDPRYGIEGVKHHPFPVPHPTGFLTFHDGLERSCNIFFETCAWRLGIDGLRKWFTRFGLGRPTGLGIAEARGRIPSALGLPKSLILGTTWFSGIGQGQVAATPIQMANVAATLAREGLWHRPMLVQYGQVQTTTRPTTPDVVDLNLPPAALAEAKRGMVDVVYGAAGTATFPGLKRSDMKYCGKTGTAQASPFRIPERDEFGRVIRNEKGGVKHWIQFAPSSPGHFNPQVPWYRGFGSDGTSLKHAWFMGYAPAEQPRIAFAIMVEYGGSGGYSAGSVAKGLLQVCIDHGYCKGETSAPIAQVTP